jgi:hypothetical protein
MEVWDKGPGLPTYPNDERSRKAPDLDTVWGGFLFRAQPDIRDIIGKMGWILIYFFIA